MKLGIGILVAVFAIGQSASALVTRGSDHEAASRDGKHEEGRKGTDRGSQTGVSANIKAEAANALEKSSGSAAEIANKVIEKAKSTSSTSSPTGEKKSAVSAKSVAPKGLTAADVLAENQEAVRDSANEINTMISTGIASYKADSAIPVANKAQTENSLKALQRLVDQVASGPLKTQAEVDYAEAVLKLTLITAEYYLGNKEYAAMADRAKDSFVELLKLGKYSAENNKKLNELLERFKINRAELESCEVASK